jgi:hypothetical protein
VPGHQITTCQSPNHAIDRCMTFALVPDFGAGEPTAKRSNGRRISR